ncbi:MAG: alpha/beta hydrolase [Shinella sp.]|nr:alpha/beta hydrolase [Shinella sp.]
MTSIDPGAERVLALGKASGAAPFETGTPAQARLAYNASCPGLQGEKADVASVEDVEIPGPGGPLAMRLYRGRTAPAEGAPAALYFHGGGWVVGNLDSHDEICRLIAELAGAVVLCPDYRLAPEHKFPAALEDCAAALAWLRVSAEAVGVDARRIAVAGDSAGGNLAAVLALMSRSDVSLPLLSAQLLIYPNTDARQTADSYRRFAEGYGLTASTMRWFRDHYVRDAADITDWRVSPLLAADLSGAPAAFVALAGLDILADEGEAYAARLQAAGVPTVISRRPDQIHGFASMGRYVPAAREVVREAVAAWQGFEREAGRG